MATRTSGPQEASVRCGDSSTLYSPKKETQQEGETVAPPAAAGGSYWPALRRRMAEQDGAAGQVVRGECPICYEPVEVLGRGPWQDEDEDEDEGEGEDGLHRAKDCVVVACGHMVCPACAVELKLGQAGEKHDCPVCRRGLRCSKCGVQTLHLGAPGGRRSPAGEEELGPASRLPGGRDDLLRVTFPPFELVCPRCTALSQWMKRIADGDWPSGAGQIEPGFVEFVYHLAHELEVHRGQVVTYRAVVDAFAAVMEAEFTNLMAQRDRYLKTTVERMGARPDATPWFEHIGSFTSRGHGRGVV